MRSASVRIARRTTATAASPSWGWCRTTSPAPASISPRSAVIGDRLTDLEFARNLGVRGLRVQLAGAPNETWPAIADELLSRRATFARKTQGDRDRHRRWTWMPRGPSASPRGHGFFDHMLEQLARHGGFALTAADCKGDLHIDEHHTVEDCALALGSALKLALGDKRGIARYGFLLPMDETRVQVAIDLSGRPYAVFEGKFPRTEVGGLATELVPHFFRSLGETLGAAHACQRHGRQHAPHGRGLLQGRGPRAAPGLAPRRQRTAVHQGSAVDADVVVIDSGGANLASLGFALARLGVESTVSTDPARIRRASHVLLPGVGSAHDAMARLTRCRTDEAHSARSRSHCWASAWGCSCCSSPRRIRRRPRRNTGPGRHRTARSTRLAGAPDRPVPHMGWNQLEPLRADPLLDGHRPLRLRVLRAQLRRAGHGGHAGRHRLRAAASHRWCARAISAACSFIPSARRPWARACWPISWRCRSSRCC